MMWIAEVLDARELAPGVIVAVHHDPDARQGRGRGEHPRGAAHGRRDHQRHGVRPPERRPGRSRQLDWFTVAPGGLILPDVAGRLLFVPGRESVAFIAPVFETGDPRYQWLNAVQAVGKGIMSADLSRIDYDVYELQ